MGSFLVKPITSPEKEVVTLKQVKTYMRLNDGTQDALLKTLIKTAVLWVENQTHRSLLNKTYQCLYPHQGRLEFPYLPYVRLEKIIGFFDYKREQSRPLHDFSIEAEGITVPFKGPWIEMSYVAGYGEGQKDIPADLVQAVLLTIIYLFDLRSGSVDRGPIDEILKAYHVRRL